MEKEEYSFESEYQYLDKLNFPEDIRKLTIPELNLLAREIRDKIIRTVSSTGGHLGSPLGAVELTIALPYIFNSPKDKIVLDTGHQSYPHKLLTGRARDFDKLRQHNGISGFCKIDESEHDIFGAGHAGTAISAALGIAIARDIKKEDYKVVALVGDASLTCGLTFEGLNHLGYLKTNMLIVLNDNNMSISPSTGALSNYLKRASSHYPEYVELRKNIGEILKKVSPLNTLQKKLRIEETIRPLISPGVFFEEMGIRYYGPIDGHNISDLLSILRYVRDMDGPVILHTITQKGKGYSIAENDTGENLHGMTPFNINNGEKYKKQGNLSYTEVFSEAMIKLGYLNERVVAITSAMKTGTGLKNFEKHFPNRFFDVGIAEQHAVTLAGGLARNGLMPICAIYSTFLQRAYDQIIHDICIQNLPVTFAIDRAGLVGEDGATHQGSFDIAYLRSIPNMTLMVPKDENELQHMLYTSTLIKAPSSVRYPRGAGIGLPLEQGFKEIPLGKGEIIRNGKGDIAIIGVGPVLYDAMSVCDGLNLSATVVNARFVKPIDKKLINEVVSSVKNILLLEEGSLSGGFCSAVLECLERKNRAKNIKSLGIPDVFIEHGPQATQRELCGLNREGIIGAIKGFG